MTKSQLPAGKTWDSFDFTRLPLNVARQMETLRDGSFLDRRENILIFGKPGSGKSHALVRLFSRLGARALSAVPADDHVTGASRATGLVRVAATHRDTRHFASGDKERN